MNNVKKLLMITKRSAFVLLFILSFVLPLTLSQKIFASEAPAQVAQEGPVSGVPLPQFEGGQMSGSSQSPEGQPVTGVGTETAIAQQQRRRKSGLFSTELFLG